MAALDAAPAARCKRRRRGRFMWFSRDAFRGMLPDALIDVK
jgi:hypothetical protein